MRVGVFTALLAQMPLDDVIAKLKGLGVTTVELGTGNYPGDPHCKLSMLEDKAARKEFKQKLDRQRHHHQRAELPRQSAASGSGIAPSTIRKSARRPFCWPRSWACRW